MTLKQDELAARRAALRLLAGVLGARRPLDEAETTPEENLSAADRARAGRLARAVLRNLGRADTILTPLVDRRPPLKVLNALRLAVVEVAELGAPPHGAVSAAVEIIRRGAKTRHMTGFANAVLRKATGPALAVAWAPLPPDPLPKWLRNSLLTRMDADRIARIEAAHLAGAPTDLTPGPRMTDDIRSALPATVLPTGSLRLAPGAQISTLPGYDQGAFWVQDAAAALPALALHARAGEHVLDLCAAPGGKTMQLAATGARVTAVDVAPARLARLEENLSRTGLEAEIIAADLLDWEPPAPVDAILLDAPCSATGTIRRHPDLPYVRDGSGLKDLAALQTNLLARAATWLKPGGRLVFATCSLLEMEGERHACAPPPGLCPESTALQLPGVDPSWVGDSGLRLSPDNWTDLGGMDGFFIASFTKAITKH